MKRFLLDSGFDQLDIAILEELQVNGRISIADLARKIHLSQPAVHSRIRRLEREGIIQQYVALVDREAAGYDLLCFIRITLQPHSREVFCNAQKVLEELPSVLECYRMTGNYDLLLKVVLRDRADLERFIEEHLMVITGIDRIDTDLVLNEVKQTTALQLKRT
jgi:Lrp/AsnC family transcriptional regulator, leucine-responsive regulatory protein